MSVRLFCRGLPRKAAWSSVRLLSHRVPQSGARPVRTARWSRIGLASGAVLTASILLGNPFAPIHADAEEKKATDERPKKPLSSLMRTYIVYTFCSIPALVDWSPTILSTLTSVPGLKQLTELVVRATFFKQFVGGDTARDALPVLEELRAENKGCLFAYMVEVDEAEAAGKTKDKGKLPVHKQIVNEMINCIDVAADFEARHTGPNRSTVGKTWVAVKLTAILPNAQSLINFSKHLLHTRPAPSTHVPFPGCPHSSDLDVLYTKAVVPGSPLTDEDIADLKELHADLIRVCARAQEKGIRIIVDAEHSWYQPAIDAFVLSITRQFNKLSPSSPNVQPLVYASYQAYLRRTPAYLAESLAQAKAGGYSLGVKLIRGAYHPHEIAAHRSTTPSPSSSPSSSAQSLSISPEPLPPVWPTKPETDACYDACATMLIGDVAADIHGANAGSSSSTGSWSFASYLPFNLFRGATEERSQSTTETSTQPPSLGLFFGTHNWQSSKLILDELVNQGLASVEGVNADGEAIIRLKEGVSERVTMAQLLGMKDELTDYLVERTKSDSPFVLKNVPYGTLHEVMPYLSRRAIENKSVLGEGAAAHERRRAAAEIRKRLFG